MDKESEKDRRRRLAREIAVFGGNFRCGECSRICYYRETEQWECQGSYCNPSERACWRFRLSGGRPVEGTFPTGRGPNLGPARDKALETIARIDKEIADEEAAAERERNKVTNYDWLMKRFQEDRDLLIDYLQCTDCSDCEHENVCEVAHKDDFVSCREFLREWLNKEHKE